MKGAVVRAVVLLGVVYLAAGIVLGALAGQAESIQARNAWRWAAWIVSALGFGAHIVYEQVRLGSSPRVTALHVSAGAALGALGLAVAANVHELTISTHPRPMILLSLAIWPVMTAAGAFIVALVTAILLAKMRRSA